MGTPAVTLPTKGTGTTVLLRQEASWVSSKARGLAESRCMKRMFCNLCKWLWTLAVEDKPTALQISRTDGG